MTRRARDLAARRRRVQAVWSRVEVAEPVVPAERPLPYVWHWRARLPERHGQRLQVICRGKLNAALVEFEDGFRAITSRNALRRSL